MYPSILFIDDDIRILKSFKRNLSTIFNVFTADSPQQGLNLVEKNGPFSVVVSDMRMPGMNGVEVLNRVQNVNEDIVRILLTGYADQQTAIEAVNQCNLFRFLIKPCEINRLTATLWEGVREYQRVVSNKCVVGSTLSGVVNLLSQTLSLVNPMAQRKANRLKRYCRHLVTGCSAEIRWTVESAALLSQLGELSTVKKSSAVTPVEDITVPGNFGRPSELTIRLLMHVPAFENIIEIMALQGKPLNRWPKYPDPQKQYMIHLCGRILQIATGFDAHLLGGLTFTEALAAMRSIPELYAPDLLSLLAARDFEGRDMMQLSLLCDDLKPGMILCSGVQAVNGSILAFKNETITETLLVELKESSRGLGVQEPIPVLVPITSFT
jgi:response regulator RpfG family c-di-GMP phosphodiesterase